VVLIITKPSLTDKHIKLHQPIINVDIFI